MNNLTAVYKFKLYICIYILGLWVNIYNLTAHFQGIKPPDLELFYFLFVRVGTKKMSLVKTKPILKKNSGESVKPPDLEFL